MKEDRHFISITRYSHYNGDKRICVSKYCNYVNSHSYRKAVFENVQEAYEYAKWQSEKQGLGLMFSDGIDREIFPDAYKKDKPKKKKGRKK